MADDPTPDPEPKPDPTPDPPEPKPDPEGLGDAGKKALDEERLARRTAEKEAKAVKAELDKLRKAGMSDQEKAVADARAEARAEASKEANARLVRSEVKAAAAGKLADPGDAPALLGDLDRFVGDDGEVDTKAVESAIDSLVKTKPYLAQAGSRAGRLPGGGAKPSDGVSMNDLIRRAAGRS